MHLNDAPAYLDINDYQNLMQQVKYKPEWTLSVFQDPYEGPCLYLTADVVDGYDHSSTVPLRIRSNIPHHTDAQQFYTWLQWRLIQVEIHECREYFHVGGAPFSDPHDVIEPIPHGDERLERTATPDEDAAAFSEDISKEVDNRLIESMNEKLRSDSYRPLGFTTFHTSQGEVSGEVFYSPHPNPYQTTYDDIRAASTILSNTEPVARKGKSKNFEMEGLRAAYRAARRMVDGDKSESPNTKSMNVEMEAMKVGEVPEGFNDNTVTVKVEKPMIHGGAE